jgi:hypothetical protein
MNLSPQLFFPILRALFETFFLNNSFLRVKSNLPPEPVAIFL